MINNLLYLAAVDDDKVAIMATQEPGKMKIIPRNKIYEVIESVFVAGVIGDGLYSCLYSKALNKFYTDYYRRSSKIIYYLNKDNTYTELHARLTLPVCSVYALDDRFIIVSTNNAYITRVYDTPEGFTGLVFSYVIWEHKLILLSQTFKLFGDGLYFVFNNVFILKSDLSLLQVYVTNKRKIVALQKKYGLHPQSDISKISDEDMTYIKNNLQLFNLNARDDGVYIDDLCIMKKKGES